MDEEREMVLRMLKEGKITVEEADALLQELVEQRPEETAARRVSPGAAEPPLGPEPLGPEPLGPEPPGPESPGAEIPNVREELRTVFKDLIDSIPKDVIRGLKQAREAFGPQFIHVVRGLHGLVGAEAETNAEETMQPGEQLTLRNAWGDVSFTASGDERLRVHALKRVWATTAEDARREAEALAVDVRRDGGKVDISVQRPMRPTQRSRVDFQIAVPAGVSVQIDVAKGDVSLDGLRGALSVRLARGDVSVREQEGNTEMDVFSGDIRLGTVRGDLRLDVRHGDVSVREVTGRTRGRIINGDVSIQDGRDLSLDVIHGDVEAARLSGAVDVETKSGDIALARLRARDVRVRTLSGDVQVLLEELGEGPVSVETVSGDIEVSLPGSARATIEAATRSGSVHSGLALQQASSDRRSLRGVLNGPGVTVRLSATSGDIEIRESRA